MNIRRIIEAKGSEAVFTVPETTTLTQLVKDACSRNIGAMLITDAKGNLAGIISERDIMRHVDRKTNFDKVTVGEVMTRNLIVVDPDDDINKAMDLMIKQKIRHLPVIANGQICGLITVRDLLLAMRKADEDEVKKLVEYLQTYTGSDEKEA